MFKKSYQLSVVLDPRERPADSTYNSNVYTNNDSLSGTIVLTVAKPIRISTLEVSFVGHAAVALSEFITTNNNSNNIVLSGPANMINYDNNFLNENIILFPPNDMRSALSVTNAESKESESCPGTPETINFIDNNKKYDFTLNPGTYNYPFSFKIPVKINSIPNELLQYRSTFLTLDTEYSTVNDNDMFHYLPPSFIYTTDDSFIKILYYLKVVLKRASIFKLNNKIYKPIRFRPKNLFLNYEFPCPETSISKFYFLNLSKYLPKDHDRKIFHINEYISSIHDSALLNPSFNLQIKFTNNLNSRIFKHFDPLNNNFKVNLLFKISNQLIDTFKTYGLIDIKNDYYLSFKNLFINAIKINLISVTTLKVKYVKQSRNASVPIYSNDHLNLPLTNMFKIYTQNGDSSTNPEDSLDPSSFTNSNVFKFEIPNHFFENEIINCQIPSFLANDVQRKYKLMVAVDISNLEDLSDYKIYKNKPMSDLSQCFILKYLCVGSDIVLINNEPNSIYSTEEIHDLYNRLNIQTHYQNDDDYLPSYDDRFNDILVNQSQHS
ncbi:Art10p ASCRUDRAFT_94852 [Ascoidea rubescens DSM 1968]|uniref:Arrestin-like N-terminal domain-containing protein n=1 Tax=Ascoidea rubescens DSM 1968 TaxID=1344418 RepID=A0A1D2VP23_9ASCO|nr:hypothetical protein ASCRUDRAFT_94852 [Ascoidea rubescens DSM 1968]ODV63372.1 hypothetical protein ASCRUDRAFT_94852 [Ascoidea rubescens DSM 1968]